MKKMKIEEKRHEETLRIEALNAATHTYGGGVGCEDLIKYAEWFYDFLKKGEQSELIKK